MDRTELMNILPHREGMLLLDEAEKAGEEARGRLRGFAFLFVTGAAFMAVALVFFALFYRNF